jgi:hypothetical protein
MEALITQSWVTLYSKSKVKDEIDDLSFSALISEDRILSDKKDRSWGLDPDGGRPGLVLTHTKSKVDWNYESYYGRGIEPIVLLRDFYEQKKPIIELAEDIRLYFNLWYDDKNDTYTQIQDDGNEIIVVRVSTNKVVIRRDYIDLYLAMRRMNLVIYTDFIKYMDYAGSEISKDVKRKNLVIDYIVKEYKDILNSNRSSYMLHFRSKQYLRYDKKFDPVKHENEQQKYLEFEFTASEDNNNIKIFSCNPDGLRDFFGKNPDAPFYLTPVFFRKEVLEKYFGSPDKYLVNDGLLTARGLWTLRMDNNIDKEVSVFLGDLRSLPLSEQYYWKSFNIVNDSKISSVQFKRSFMAEAADPSQIDLLFRQHYAELHDIWIKKIGWPIFRELNQADTYHLSRIRLLTSENQSAFDEIVLSLHKLLVESINVAKLSKILPPIENEKSIDKILRYLSKQDAIVDANFGKFLKELHTLRSASSAHMKGENYLKARKKFENSEKDGLKEIIVEIITRADNVVLDLMNFATRPNYKTAETELNEASKTNDV